MVRQGGIIDTEADNAETRMELFECFVRENPWATGAQEVLGFR